MEFLGVGKAPGFVDRSGTVPRGGGGFGGMFLDSSDGLGGGARTKGRGGGAGAGSSRTSLGVVPPNPNVRGSRVAGILMGCTDAGCGGGVLRICSETCRCVGGVAANPSERGSRDEERSDTVFAREGAVAASRLGGRDSGFANPNVRGSRIGAVEVRAKPIDRGSMVFGGVVVRGPARSKARLLSELDMSSAAGGSRGEPGLSSLSGGVENGDSLASEEGRLGTTGCKVAESGTGRTF